ncbi:MAG: hypothetical protein PHX22_10985, partial [Dysgonamonadaceae bacterium]|nr:hypothetical protein [Dysgonamonadaceae bacterium]
GYFEVYNNSKLESKGLFYSTVTRRELSGRGLAAKIDDNHHETLTETELKTLVKYASEKGIPLYTEDQFLENTFFPEVFKMGTVCVGQNLPFDLSRIAKRVELTNPEEPHKSDFILILSDNTKYPALKIKKLGNANSISFTKEFTDVSGSIPQGFFIDVGHVYSVLFGSGTSRLSLAFMSENLGVPTPKQKIDESMHGTITEDYIDYNIDDVKATAGVYDVLFETFSKYGLTNMQMTDVYSGASMGKKLLDILGISGYLDNNPNYSRGSFARPMAGYFGGRVEARNRLDILETTTLDFKSMYPTVVCLLDLWDFIIATDYSEIEATEQIQDLLASITLEQMTDPETWPRLVGIAKIKLNGDRIPTRAGYGEDGDAGERSVCLSDLYGGKEVWVSLPDLAASKILTGKTPTVVEGIIFKPGAKQKSLKPAKILGFNIDPKKTNLIKFLVETRESKKAEMRKIKGAYKKRVKNNTRYQELFSKKRLTTPEKAEMNDLKNGYENIPEYKALDGLQLSLKILANSLGYGIFIELITQDDKDILTINGGMDTFEAIGKAEKPGRYYHPILGCLITSGARLMLAIAEAKVKDLNYKHYYMDTDSIFVPPSIAKEVSTFFNPLNPYNPEIITEVLEIEDKFNIYDSKADTWKKPMYSFRISSKRYVVFTFDEDGLPDMENMDGRLHGLGHIKNPFYEEIMEFSERKKQAGGDERLIKWQNLIWKDLILLEQGLINETDITADFGEKYAIGSLSISVPSVYHRFRMMNSGKHWLDQIKPFNFFTIGYLKNNGGDKSQPTYYLSPKKTKNPQDMLKQEKVLDSRTGKFVVNDKTKYKTLDYVINNYYKHPEQKLEGERGFLETKQFCVDDIIYHGKETPRMNPFNSTFKADREIQIFQAPADNLALLESECKRVTDVYNNFKERVKASEAIAPMAPEIKKLFKLPRKSGMSDEDYKAELIKGCEGVVFKIKNILEKIETFRNPEIIRADVREFTRRNLIFLKSPYAQKVKTEKLFNDDRKAFILSLNETDGFKMGLTRRTFFNIKNKVKNDKPLNTRIASTIKLILYVEKHFKPEGDK